MSNDRQLRLLWNPHTQIIYLNYCSTTTQLVSEKTLLDETKTSNFCFLIVYVGVVYINRKAVKCRLNYL